MLWFSVTHAAERSNVKGLWSLPHIPGVGPASSFGFYGVQKPGCSLSPKRSHLLPCLLNKITFHHDTLLLP
jgi:hypothetical protein